MKRIKIVLYWLYQMALPFISQNVTEPIKLSITWTLILINEEEFIYHMTVVRTLG